MHRPVKTVEGTVLVPLGPACLHYAKLDRESWEFLRSLNYGNLNYIKTPRGNIYATVPSKLRGVKVMVARLLTNAMQGEIVRFKNGDTLDLTLTNLEKQKIRKSNGN